jgi:hypothetical protein
MSSEQIRLVDEVTLDFEQGCSFCPNEQPPYTEMPTAKALYRWVDGNQKEIGAVYACSDCASAVSESFGVVPKPQFDTLLERAQEAEERLAGAEHGAKAAAATIAKLEKQLVQMEARAVAAEGALAPTEARVEELLAENTPEGRRQRAIAEFQARASEQEGGADVNALSFAATGE